MFFYRKDSNITTNDQGFSRKITILLLFSFFRQVFLRNNLFILQKEGIFIL